MASSGLAVAGSRMSASPRSLSSKPPIATMNEAPTISRAHAMPPAPLVDDGKSIPSGSPLSLFSALGKIPA